MKRFLITAGPTREPIDSIRFVTNASSGRTGIAVADAVVRRGHEAILVCGPTPHSPLEDPRLITVSSALEMAAVMPSPSLG